MSERALLQELLNRWKSIAEDQQVPDELNDGIFDRVESLLGQPSSTRGSPGQSSVALKTQVGVFVPLDDYNASRDELAKERHLKVRAYQVIRGLCGGVARDFDQLEALLQTDGAMPALTPGIAVRVSEELKDIAVERAHAAGLTLGSWLQQIVDEALSAQPHETAGRIGPTAPDNDLVICPQCTSQFKAIPVNVQSEVRRLREALECLLPGLALDLRYAEPDDDRDALVSRVRTVEEALSGHHRLGRVAETT